MALIFNQSQRWAQGVLSVSSASHFGVLIPNCMDALQQRGAADVNTTRDAKFRKSIFIVSILYLKGALLLNHPQLLCLRDLD